MKDCKTIAVIGAIGGDIIGSPYEFFSTKDYDFRLFNPNSRITDDSVMTIAVAEWIIKGGNLSEIMQKWGRGYMRVGYGGMFKYWLKTEKPRPYNSFGNGSAMRVSAVGCAYDSLDETLAKAKESAEVTHNHPEGVKGAQATAAAIFMARTGSSKEEIKQYVGKTFGYDLNRTIEEIRPGYSFEVSCQGSVPESIIAFLESSDYESAVRLAVSLGGDADTMGAIAGGIAAAFYGEIPDDIYAQIWSRVPDDLQQTVMRLNETLSNR